MKKLLSYLLIVTLLFTFSCKKEEKTQIEKLQSIEVQIKGMTCEIGCAKLIQSKVYKLEGVKESKVNFKEEKGTFTFDENKISANAIAEKINGIAGGDLYKVTDIKKVENK